jgi:hypothetical protein
MLSRSIIWIAYEYVSLRSGFFALRSGGGRPLVGPRSGGGRASKNDETPIISLPFGVFAR